MNHIIAYLGITSGKLNWVGKQIYEVILILQILSFVAENEREQY